MLIKEGWQKIMTKPYWSVGVRYWWRSPLSGAWWIAPEIGSNTYLDVDVDKNMKKEFNDKSTLVRGGLSLVEITIVGKPWEGIQLQKRDPRSGCNHTCNRSSSGRGRWELQGTNLSEMKAPGVRDLDFHQWHLSKINVCLRDAPRLLLVDTFYLDQLIILSIMHWRIRGQHCEIPPDNHHQVPGSY